MEDPDLTEADVEPTEASATKREGQHTRRPAGKSHREGVLDRGTPIGRYVVLDLLGEGGMGVVYAAYDPKLDRKVAIKLLQASADREASTGNQAWLEREAQALARLSHPNVIAVHDVGTLPGDRVFVAMELVEGTTLRGWLKASTRSWREAQVTLLAAGHGLAAAHAAGLVHRDFKPDNVLVGSDGRVRVMDFGLARLDTSDEPSASRTSDLEIETRSPLSSSLTQAGSVVGTPAYIAPEIFVGQPASALTDQFAFGVTLYEALYRTRPYDKKALREASATPVAAPVPPRSDVPPRLQRVVMRAIALDPAQRYPSMAELLADLAVDPRARRRRVMLGAGAVVLIGGALALTGVLARSHAALCTGAERRLAGVWDPTTRATIRAAFTRGDRPFAMAAFDGFARTVDAYASQWSAAVTEACEATRLRGEQTEDDLRLRQDCLDQRLEELRAFTQLVTAADATTIEKAASGALSLEPLPRCADVATLRAPEQPAAALRPAIERARARLADAKAGLITGNVGRAINAGGEAAEAAKAIPFAPLEAEARFVLGMADLQIGNAPDAATTLADATWIAMRSRRDDIAALAAINLALTVSEGLNKDGEAQIWLDLSRATAARLGSERHLALQLVESEGIVAGNRGDLIAAAAAHQRAVDLAEQLYGRDNTIVARDHQLLAATLSRASDYPRALAHYERARTLLEAFLGPDHPDIALVLSGLATCYHYTGQIAQSKAAFERALAIRERVFGASSPVLIPTLNNYAELLRDEGDPARGLALVERARGITEHTVGRAHPYFVIVTATEGELLAATGRLDEARATLDTSVAAAEKVSSPYLPEAQAARAKLAVDERQWALAGELADKAVAGFETKAGKDAGDLWKPLTSLALAKIGQGNPAAARPLLERALAIGAQSKLPAAYLAPTRAALAALPAAH